jgi:hypothetical protein
MKPSTPIPTRFRDRLHARLFARRLDRKLAAGASPACSVPMALRARALVQPGTRETLAASLRRIACADGSAPVSTVRVPASLAQVSRARWELERLARRLSGARPVDPRGVALTCELLRDGTGPVYWYRSGEDLGARVRHVLRALEVGEAL